METMLKAVEPTTNMQIIDKPPAVVQKKIEPDRVARKSKQSPPPPPPPQPARPTIGTAAPSNREFRPEEAGHVKVRDMAKQWEDNRKKEIEEEEATNLSKKWMSMPDLKHKKQRQQDQSKSPSPRFSAEPKEVIIVEKKSTSPVEKKSVKEVKSKDSRRRQQQQQQQQQMTRTESIGELAPSVVVPDPESADDRAVCQLV